MSAINCFTYGCWADKAKIRNILSWFGYYKVVECYSVGFQCVIIDTFD